MSWHCHPRLPHPRTSQPRTHANRAGTIIAACSFFLLTVAVGSSAPAQVSSFASIVCSSLHRDQQACTASLASLASPFHPTAPAASRALLAAPQPSAFLSITYTLWCEAHPAQCDRKATLASNYTTDASKLPGSINLPVLFNGSWTQVAAYPASGLWTPRIGQRSSGSLCTPTAHDCYLDAQLPVQQSSFRLRATFACFMINTTANDSALLGYPNSTGPVYTVSLRPVGSAITCRATALGPIFVAFYYPLDSATTLDRYQSKENNPSGQKYLKLKLKFKVQVTALSPSEQDEFKLSVRKSVALQLGYLDSSTSSNGAATAANTSKVLLVGNIQVEAVAGSTLTTLLYAPPNTTDWQMYRFWKRLEASDGQDLFGEAFAEKHGDGMFLGAGYRVKKSRWKQKVLWASVAAGAVLLVAGGVAWMWRGLYKEHDKAGPARS